MNIRAAIIILILCVLAVLFATGNVRCRVSMGSTVSEPIYLNRVVVQFTDGTSWSTTKPAWATVTYGSDGIVDRRICQGAAPATTQP